MQSQSQEELQKWEANRKAIESTHIHLQDVAQIYATPIIESLTAGSEKLYLHDYQKFVGFRGIADLSPEDCEDFCCKDCVVYSNVHSAQHKANFNAIWREWYPRRSMAEDMDYGNFFCKFMKYRGMDKGDERLRDLVTFHRALCAKVESVVPNMKQWQPDIQRWAVCDHPDSLAVKLHVRNTLPVVFLIIEWGFGSAVHTVLVVCRGENAARDLGLIDGEEGVDEEEDLAFVDNERALWLVFRAKLQRAMRAVVFRDMDRRTPRTDNSQFYKERYKSEGQSVLAAISKHSTCP